jgi:hypothetical protein
MTETHGTSTLEESVEEAKQSGMQKSGLVGMGRGKRPLGHKFNGAVSWQMCGHNVEKLGELAMMLSQGLSTMLSMEAAGMAFCTIVAIALVCPRMLNISFEVDFAIFSAGCIFPLTFNVGVAFSRREAALEAMSTLKANIFAIYLHFSSFDLTDTGKAAADALPIFQRLLSNIETHLRGKREHHAGLVWGDTSPIQVS